MSILREGLEIFSEDHHILFGARQTGKSTIIKKQVKVDYFFSMESIVDRQRFAHDDTFLIRHIENDLKMPIKKTKKRVKIGIDEIHKLHDWKRRLKLWIDEYKDNLQFFVSGSSAFDLIRNDGDSLIGRVFYTKVFPFTFCEFLATSPLELKHSIDDYYEDLLKITFRKTTQPLELTAYPEPCLKKNNTWGNRWANNYLTQLIEKDLREISRVPDIDSVHKLLRLVIEGHGSTISVDSFRKTLLKSHDSINNMLLALEKVWALWQLKPFQNSEARTIRKESKYYVLDWIFDDFFETKVAISLMKRVTILRQITGKKYEFFFYRDYHEREVDFIITLNQKPILAIEAKETEQNIPSALQYFCKTYKCPGIVLTKNLTQLDFKNNFIICGFDRFARAYL